MNRTIPAVLAAAPLAILATGANVNAQYDVAIVAAASNTANAQAEPRYTDVRDKLMATGMFDSVTIINATGIGDGVGTPPLNDLLQFDAIICWSNDSFDNAVTMGDVLADYVDAGKGVVVGVFANTSTNPQRFLQGRWLSDPGYIAIPQQGGFVQGSSASLGTVFVPGHPILDGVTLFFNNAPPGTGGIPFGAWRPAQTALTTGSTRIANWSTGQTLIALAPNAGVVELGFHPVSSAVNAGYWDETTDGGLIMANALKFAADTVPDPADCPGDVAGAGGMPDGQVNVEDLNAILSVWNTSVGVGSPLDLAGNDGIVNVEDLNVILGNWQQPC